jgi:hypothetical protein
LSRLRARYVHSSEACGDSGAVLPLWTINTLLLLPFSLQAHLSKAACRQLVEHIHTYLRRHSTIGNVHRRRLVNSPQALIA